MKKYSQMITKIIYIKIQTRKKKINFIKIGTILYRIDTKLNQKKQMKMMKIIYKMYLDNTKITINQDIFNLHNIINIIKNEMKIYICFII